MLQMRPNCEACDSNILMNQDAYICTFECTFCPKCAHETLKYVCPNCEGELVIRPKRDQKKWLDYPVWPTRITKLLT